MLGIIAIIVILFVIDIAQIEPSSQPVTPEEDLNQVAENFVADGQLYRAIDVYTQILNETPDDEYTWHQKGKLLNRLGDCSNAQSHYQQYLERFSDSLRGLEGYKIAKNCSP